jgi:hypothetical protein
MFYAFKTLEGGKLSNVCKQLGLLVTFEMCLKSWKENKLWPHSLFIDGFI